MRVVDKCDDPNAIHRWNRFKCEMIKKPNYYKKPFKSDEREAGTSWNFPGCHYLRPNNFVAFITGNKIP